MIEIIHDHYRITETATPGDIEIHDPRSNSSVIVNINDIIDGIDKFIDAIVTPDPLVRIQQGEYAKEIN